MIPSRHTLSISLMELLTRIGFYLFLYLLSIQILCHFKKTIFFQYEYLNSFKSILSSYTKFSSQFLCFCSLFLSHSLSIYLYLCLCLSQNLLLLYICTFSIRLFFYCFVFTIYWLISSTTKQILTHVAIDFVVILLLLLSLFLLFVFEIGTISKWNSLNVID